jgi:ribosomal protein S18 acetylase RimI-like enzyme
MKTADVVIRPAVASDAKGIGQLGALLVRTHHDFDPRRFIPEAPETAQRYGAYLGTQMGEPNVVVLVAEHDGQIFGYTYAGVESWDYMSLRGPAGVLYDIVVHPDQRRAGVGRRLLDATIVALRARGALQIVLSTAEQNVPAQRLFASAGFRRTMIEMTRDL